MKSRKGITTIAIIGIIIGVLAVLGAVSFFVVTKDSVRPAFLKVNQGEVLVDNGKGFEQVTGEVKLDVTSKVKTGPDGRATIVLFESLIQLVEPNTELSIEKLAKENPKIQQTAGNTWNKFTALTGMDSYEVETPNSVAIVRGTGYTVELDGIKVIDGMVEVETSDGEKYQVETGRALVMENGTWIERDLTPDEIAYLLGKLKESILVLKELRDGLLIEHEFVVDLAREASGMTDDELREYLNEMDNNQHDVQEIYDQAPGNNAIVIRLAELTRAIQDENKIVSSLETSD